MLVYTDSDYCVELSKLKSMSDADLAKTNIFRESCEYYTSPIALKNVNVKRNAKGYLTIHFETHDPKYLNIFPAMSYRSWGVDAGVNCEYGSRGIIINSQSEYFDARLGFNRPCQTLELILEPETKEEADMLKGVVATMPSKYEHDLVIVPFSDFESIERNGVDIDVDDIVEFSV